MEFLEFIVDEMLIAIPVLYIIGYIIKNTPKMLDWVIPYVLVVIAVALAIGMNGLSVDSIIQGVLVAGATVLVNQGIKQVKEK